MRRFVVIAVLAVASGLLLPAEVQRVAAQAQRARTLGAEAQRAKAAPVYGYTVVNSYPHNPQAFTEGLMFPDGVLYESTGLNGQSSVRKVRLETGEVLQRQSVDSRYFAEGMTDWGNRLTQ